MTESNEPTDKSGIAPFLGALTIIVAVVIGIWLINVFSGDDLTDPQQITDYVGKLNALGADIKIVDFPDNDDSEKIISVV